MTLFPDTRVLDEPANACIQANGGLAMQTTSTTRNGSARRRLWGLALMGLMALGSAGALAQASMEREGVVLHWGLMSTAGLSQGEPIEQIYGGKPIHGGKVHHLVLALFDSKSGKRIDDAIVRAQLSEPGIVDGPPKYVPLMTVNDQASYGQVFGMVRDGPYKFKVTVQLPDRTQPIEYTISAAPQGPVQH
jgi:hypothetical protein